MKTKIKSPIFQLFLVIAVIAVISACYELPETDSINMPTWEVEELNLPIVNQTKTILEILEDDSSFAWFPEDDAESPGILYYSKNESIEGSNIGDRLKIDRTEANISSRVGPITINEIPTFEATVSISDWTPFHPDESVIVPPLTVQGQQSEFAAEQAFRSIQFNTGRIILDLENKLPFEVNYTNFRILNNDGSGVMVTKPVPDFSLEANGTRTLNIDIETGIDILSSLLITMDMSSGGTGGAMVKLDPDAGTHIVADLVEIEIGKVDAEIPQNSITIDSTFTFDSGTHQVELSLARIKSGSFTMNFESNIDIDAELDITFHDLYDAQGNSYNVTETLPRSGTLQIIESDLAGWRIETSELTDKLRYTVTARTVPTSSGDYREISEDDYFNVNLELSELLFEQVDGRFNAEFQLEEQAFHMDFGELDEKFNFEEIKLEDAFIYLDLLTSVYLPVHINDAVVTASNGLVTNSITLDQITLPSSEPIRIEVSELFNGMNQLLPSDFTFNGRADVNPLYERIQVGVADSIFGNANLEIPLKFKLTGGTFTDNVELDFSEDTKEAITDVDSLNITFEVINNIPAGVSLLVTVLDGEGNAIMTIPTASNAIEKIEVTPPILDANGNVLEESHLLEVIELTGEDILTFVEGKNMEFLIEFETAATSNEIVKMRYSDTITYRAKLDAKFRFDN